MNINDTIKQVIAYRATEEGKHAHIAVYPRNFFLQSPSVLVWHPEQDNKDVAISEQELKEWRAAARVHKFIDIVK
ncbi:hypothetical protein VPFG_00220 [Vibrio phage nt-1]|uniref:Uncharacterized protein n=1 Tax=Vibrio phage nt-1 TaxID=115992 RepID=R9TIL1_9CAUD|nr:hypothetical protein VPFG_00220 [Vibrio phage nt-1]AGN30220.1 hypothetical protein VPFG_00220 [Vibrio phage nt-1]